jgi:hypothetical protein
MHQEIINKYGKEVVKNFWIFIETLNFDSKTQESIVIKSNLLKKLPPFLADKYKEICDEMAFSLYRDVYYDKKNMYLYASFEAVSKGEQFYQKCWSEPEVIEPIVETLDQFNNFSTVLPTEDDYFNVNNPSPEDVMDDFDEYDEYLESIGNKKGNKKKSKAADTEDTFN